MLTTSADIVHFPVVQGFVCFMHDLWVWIGKPELIGDHLCDTIFKDLMLMTDQWVPL